MMMTSDGCSEAQGSPPSLKPQEQRLDEPATTTDDTRTRQPGTTVSHHNNKYDSKDEEKVKNNNTDHVQSFQGFQDYTVSSTFERFVSDLEGCIAAAMSSSMSKSGGIHCSTTIAKKHECFNLSHGFPFRREKYLLTWVPFDERHTMSQYPGVKFHTWFTPEDCFVLEPDSYSRRILSEQEYHTILSAVSVALNNLKAHGSCPCECPIFIPIFDALRDAYGGIRIRGNCVQRFQCDSLHGRVHVASEHLGELRHRLEMMSVLLRDYDAEYSAICEDAVDHGVIDGLSCVTTMTYQLYNNSNGDGHDGGAVDTDMVASSSLWAPWAHQDDPVGGVEVDVVYNDWENQNTADILDGSSSIVNGSPCVWVLHAMDVDHAPDTGERSFLPLQVVDVSRKFLQLVDVCSLQQDEMLSFPVKPTVQSGKESFSSMLHQMMRWRLVVQEDDVGGTCMDDLTMDDWWIGHVYEIEVDLDDIERIVENVLGNDETHHAQDDEHVGRSCRPGSLFERFVLHATIPDSLRGIAQLWKSFLRKLRHEYWEREECIPHVTDSCLESSMMSCNVARGLGMLNYCIALVRRKKDDSGSSSIKYGDHRGRLDISLLERPDVKITVPVTWTIPEGALVWLGGVDDADSVGDRAAVYRNMLKSDMEAFKAVNDGCTFADFIRWYSPRDWNESEQRLSKRMAGDSTWIKTWIMATPTPACQQESLFDPVKKGEQVLHYLETIHPEVLLSQMCVCLFSASCCIIRRAQSQVVRQQIAALTRVAHTVFDFESIHQLRVDSTGEAGKRVSNVLGLVNTLSCIECTAAAAMSLHQRLGGIDGALREKIVDGMIISAISNASGCTLEASEAEILADAHPGVSFDGPIAIEHRIDISDPSDENENEMPLHRLFINRLPRELRTATCITEK